MRIIRVTMNKPVQNLIVLSLVFVVLLSSCVPPAKITDDWVPLFNGKDINDWIVKIHHYEAGDNFGNTFRVQDSVIQVRYDQYGAFNDRFGHLYYKTPFTKFHLSLEYRFVGELQPGAPDY